MSYVTRLFCLCAASLALATAATAQTGSLDAAARTAAVEGVARQVEKGYVFSETGKKMADAIRARAARGEYAKVTDGAELARLLTAHLREVGNDLHLAVGYSAEVLPPEPEGPAAPSAEQLERFKSELSRDNFGFKRVEVLTGNIGYIRLDLFAPPELAADTYASAMAFVANTDALVVDLRENGGSISPDAIPMLCTYFFEQPTHLIDIKWNFEEAPRQLWTWAHVPGRRYLDKPIYVLTSRRTFSGAEELAYDLKNLGRATIVGETTGGGANPGGTRRASDHFSVFVPFGRVTSPITKTNWEGVGVAPDIEAPAGKALLVAQREAIDRLKTTVRDERGKAALAAAEAANDAALARFKTVTFELRGYEEAKEVGLAGSFNSWSPRSTPMARRGDRWVAEVEVEPGRHEYKFVVDGQWIVDPANGAKEGTGSYVNSVRQVD